MPSPSNLIIVGAGGHALSVGDAALSAGWTVVGFYSPDGAGSASILGPVLTSLDALDLSETAFALGIGTNHLRQTVAEDISQRFAQTEIVSIVHATAWVSPHATVRPGAVILAHTSVGPGSTVGHGALLNIGTSLDHESSLGDYASLGPGARTGGNVSVGERTMIGIQAGILHGVTVGSDCVVGANSLVNSDLDSNIVAWGTPARTVRTRLKDDSHY
jgi:sugar O-acyltransferase (sialic acid O-acetyltransferase NeuD family)